MARISNYNPDNGVAGDDKLIGTSSSDSQTSNYTLDSIGAYMATNNLIKSNSSFAIKFVDSANDMNHGTILKLGFGGGSTNMTSFTGFLISKTNAKGDSIEKLVRAVFEDKVVISDYVNQQIQCNYTVTNIQQSDNYANFLEVSVSSNSGSGQFVDNNYFVVSIKLESGDKSYEHDQSSPSSSWVVTHNLSKRASISVVDSAGTIILCEVQYDSDNQVTLSFDSSTSGKAYIN